MLQRAGSDTFSAGTLPASALSHIVPMAAQSQVEVTTERCVSGMRQPVLSDTRLPDALMKLMLSLLALMVPHLLLVATILSTPSVYGMWQHTLSEVHLKLTPLTSVGPMSIVLTYSTDGSTIAGGNYQATYLWDAATQKIRHRLASTYRSLGLTYSPDGSAIAGGTASRTAALSPDGTKLVTPGGGLSGDNVANLSDVATGRIVKSFTFSELTARDALIVWDVETRRIIDKLPIAAEDRYVRDIAYSPDGNTIAASVGSSVYLWDATIGRLKSRRHRQPSR